MNVHVDVVHPAQVHLFRHAIDELTAAGHDVLVTAREKEVTVDLLEAFGIRHLTVSTKGDSTLDLIAEWIGRELKVAKAAREFGADVVLSHVNPVAGHAAALSGADSVMFNDDENSTKILGTISHPFATAVCTPDCFRIDVGDNQRRYDGLHELAYLHPDRFEPDPEPLERAGLDPDEPYYVLRFVSWDAHHDVGQSGFSGAAKRDLVEGLSEQGQVFVSSEGDLPSDLSAHALPVEPHELHDLLYYADGFVGDSQTMAIEAGILGTPTVLASSFSEADAFSNSRLLEEYGLLESFGDERAAVEEAVSLAADDDAVDRWGRRRERFLEDHEDVTEFMVDVVEEVGDGH